MTQWMKDRETLLDTRDPVTNLPVYGGTKWYVKLGEYGRDLRDRSAKLYDTEVFKQLKIKKPILWRLRPTKTIMKAKRTMEALESLTNSPDYGSSVPEMKSDIYAGQNAFDTLQDNVQKEFALSEVFGIPTLKPGKAMGGSSGGTDFEVHGGVPLKEKLKESVVSEHETVLSDAKKFLQWEIATRLKNSYLKGLEESDYNTPKKKGMHMTSFLEELDINGKIDSVVKDFRKKVRTRANYMNYDNPIVETMIKWILKEEYDNGYVVELDKYEGRLKYPEIWEPMTRGKSIERKNKFRQDIMKPLWDALVQATMQKRS